MNVYIYIYTHAHTYIYIHMYVNPDMHTHPYSRARGWSGQPGSSLVSPISLARAATSSG